MIFIHLWTKKLTQPNSTHYYLNYGNSKSAKKHIQRVIYFYFAKNVKNNAKKELKYH